MKNFTAKPRRTQRKEQNQRYTPSDKLFGAKRPHLFLRVLRGFAVKFLTTHKLKTEHVCISNL
jgi:hypothetical protein